VAKNYAYGMKELVMIFAAKDRDVLGSVRCQEGLLAAEGADGIWLRGMAASGVTTSIKQLPALHSYVLDEEEQLFPINKLTPVGKLPALSWQPLARFIPVTLPVSLLPGSLSQPYFPRLVASATMQKPGALLTKLSDWKQYVEFAPLVRLDRLQFAVSGNDEALIIGEPLPPLPGKEYWLQDELLLPAGFDFDPPLLATLVSDEVNAGKDSLILFDETGNWQRISLEYLLPARRSTVRMVKEGGIYE
jgi:hypothetical protein